MSNKTTGPVTIAQLQDALQAGMELLYCIEKDGGQFYASAEVNRLDADRTELLRIAISRIDSQLERAKDHLFNYYKGDEGDLKGIAPLV